MAAEKRRQKAVREVEMNNKLSGKEKLFCCEFAASGDPRGSAARAGYLISPGRSAAKLLAREDIRREISAVESRRTPARESAEKGLYRLAFGSVSDALRLICKYDELTPEDIEKLDLFNVSDIKIPKGGGVEIKFFDRQKALERLASLEAPSEDPQSSFISALSKGAERLTEADAF